MSDRKINPTDLIESVLSDPSWDLGTLELRQNDLDRCPNAITWMTQTKYGGFTPWPRQIQFATQLFEDYCPDCSTMSVVNDMWGMNLEAIERQVMFLRNGACPQCGKNRNHFRASGQHKGYNELIGIAGQRCLDPDTPILKANGDITHLFKCRSGDLIQDRNGKLTTIKKIWTSFEPGYFRIWFANDVVVKCGHEHCWITQRGEIPSAELKITDTIEYGDSWMGLKGVDAIRLPNGCRMIDLETDSGTFLHAAGITLHNSGKTFITAVFSSYLEHRYLCLEGVCSENYGLRNSTFITTFVAGDKQQVNETTWGNFVTEIKKSPWYQRYFDYLKVEGKRLGQKLYDFKTEEYLWFPHKKLMVAFAAGNFTTLRGRTRNAGSIDELGWFESNASAKRMNGLEIYNALSNSLETIRTSVADKWNEGKYDLPSAYMFDVSSPSAEDDPIMTLAANSKANPNCFQFHLPTWEINPAMTRDRLRGKFETNPLAAQRDFAAVPGVGKNIFIPNAEQVDACIDDERKNMLQYTTEIFDVTIKQHTYNYVRALLTNVDVNRMTPFMIACDAAEAGNSYGLALCSLDEHDTSYVNGLVLITPKALDGDVARIHFPSVMDIILELRKRGLQIEMVCFDRWQSTSTVQELRDLNIDAQRYSLRYNDFLNWRANLTDRKIRFPTPEVPFKQVLLEKLTDRTPVASLLKQVRTVRDSGKMVIKPSQGDDDLFRCIVLADRMMRQNRQQFIRRTDTSSSRADSIYSVTVTSLNTMHNGIKANQTFNQQSKRWNGSLTTRMTKRKY
jgi:hypothetical protein